MTPNADAAMAWLRQQIEDDKAAAKVATAGPWHENGMAIRGGPRSYAPQDVIADCDAKLAILEEHPESNEGAGCGGCQHWPWPCPTLRLLASAYRHRDGYAGHWGTV